MSALLALALAALLALFVAVPTRRRPSRRKPVRRPPRLRRFVERLKQLARRCVVCFKQAVLIPHDSLRRPPRLRRFLGRLKPLARRCFVRFKQAIRLAPTSRSLLGLDAEAQIKAHLKHRDLHASEGTGLVYVCAAVRKRSLAAFRDLIQRERCNKNGQTHLWLWWFRVQRRCVGERLCHLFGDHITPRTGLDCTGCTGTHRDYLQLSTMGFDNLMMTTSRNWGSLTWFPRTIELVLGLNRVRGKDNAKGTYCTDSTPTGISHVHITEYTPPALRPCIDAAVQSKAHGGCLEWGGERSYVGQT
ncbi:hypothetical protein C8R46DRAFT_1037179 [Mycena filopes]|nr:hypothetical protein C8R46DRAFT_1037179 [Mycena filopes]